MVAIWYGKVGDKMFRLIQPLWLKYMQVTLSQKCNSCFVIWLLIIKCLGNHPLHERLDPPMAFTFLWHGIKSACVKCSCERCVCLLNILAPLSRKILMLIGEISHPPWQPSLKNLTPPPLWRGQGVWAMLSQDYHFNLAIMN